jgi:FlaA1/EpsC-like NDP-sugar epimerase
MGEPIKIAQMAHDLIKLAGKEPETEIEIVYTGLRAGEKLYEELISEGEGIAPTSHEKIMVLHRDGNNMDSLCSVLDIFLNTSQNYRAHEIKINMYKLVPDYTPTIHLKEIEN